MFMFMLRQFWKDLDVETFIWPLNYRCRGFKLRHRDFKLDAEHLNWFDKQLKPDGSIGFAITGQVCTM